MREVDLGGEKSFIGAWYIDDIAVCDQLIDLFKRSNRKIQGQIGHDQEVDKEVKDSIDLIVGPSELNGPVFAKYLYNLRAVTQQYTKKYEWAAAMLPWGITETVNIQYYPPGGGYKQWHTERIGKQAPAVNRHLVFMTYLNDVYDEGGTEFFHQKIKASPRKGLTLIWPSDWTHLHRGIVSPTQKKYIVTGWFSFL